MRSDDHDRDDDGGRDLVTTCVGLAATESTGRYPKPTSGHTKLKILNRPLYTKLKILNRPLRRRRRLVVGFVVVVDSRMSSRASSTTSRRPRPGPPLATVPDTLPGCLPDPPPKWTTFLLCVVLGSATFRPDRPRSPFGTSAGLVPHEQNIL